MPYDLGLTYIDQLITLILSTLSEYVLYLAIKLVQLIIQHDVSAETFDRIVALASTSARPMEVSAFSTSAWCSSPLSKTNPGGSRWRRGVQRRLHVKPGEVRDDMLNAIFTVLLFVIDGDLIKEILPLEAFQTTVSRVPARSPSTDRPAADRHRLRLLHADSPQDTQPIRDIIAMLFTTHNAVQLASYFRMSRVVNVARYNA